MECRIPAARVRGLYHNTRHSIWSYRYLFVLRLHMIYTFCTTIASMTDKLGLLLNVVSPCSARINLLYMNVKQWVAIRPSISSRRYHNFQLSLPLFQNTPCIPASSYMSMYIYMYSLSRCPSAINPVVEFLRTFIPDLRKNPTWTRPLYRKHNGPLLHPLTTFLGAAVPVCKHNVYMDYPPRRLSFYRRPAHDASMEASRWFNDFLVTDLHTRFKYQQRDHY